MNRRIIFFVLVFALLVSACNGATIPPAATQTNEISGPTLTLGAPTGGVVQPLLGEISAPSRRASAQGARRARGCAQFVTKLTDIRQKSTFRGKLSQVAHKKLHNLPL